MFRLFRFLNVLHTFKRSWTHFSNPEIPKRYKILPGWTGYDSPMSVQEYLSQHNVVEINYKKIGVAITFNIPPPGLELIYKPDKRELLLKNNCN